MTTPDKSRAKAITDALRMAAIDCPHEIESDRITLHFDSKQSGHNALNQLWTRIANAITQSVEQHEAAPADAHYEALEREHLGDPEKKTGIYAENPTGIGYDASDEELERILAQPTSSAPLEGTGNGADERMALADDMVDYLYDLARGYTKEKFVKNLQSLFAASAPRTEVAGAVPEGWKLVPHIPTKEMLEAGCEQWHRVGTTTDAWQAMFCAAPDAPTED